MTIGRFALYDRTDQFNGDGRACRIRRICAVHTISDGKIAQFDRVLVCGKRERNGTIPVRKLCALKFAVLEQSYRNAGDPDAAGRLNRYRIFLFSGTCRNADRGQYEHDTDQQASDDLTHDLLRPPEMIFPCMCDSDAEMVKCAHIRARSMLPPVFPDNILSRFIQKGNKSTNFFYHNCLYDISAFPINRGSLPRAPLSRAYKNTV